MSGNNLRSKLMIAFIKIHDKLRSCLVDIVPYANEHLRK